MGIFSSLFGTSAPTPDSKFAILRDDGLRAMQMGELPYAEKCFTAALEMKDDLRTQSFLAEVYLRMKNYEKALPLLQRLASSAESNVEVRLLLAQTLGKLKRYDEQKDVCQALIDEDANEPRALYLMAEAEQGQGNLISAIARLTQCLTLRPDYTQARFLRAKVLTDMQQLADALTDADELIATDATDVDWRMLRARLYLQLGRTDEGMADLREVLAQNPFCDEAILLLGESYERNEQWKEALAVYDEAIEQRDNFALAYKARGQVKYHLNDSQGAAEDLKKALTLSPEVEASIDGQFTNLENEMKQRYKILNPYGF